MSEITVRKLSAGKAADWKRIAAVIRRAAPPQVQVTDALLDDVRSAINTGEMSAWSFENGTPIGVMVSMMREDRILGRRDLLIYAAAGERRIRDTEWVSCFNKVKSHALANQCTHIAAFSIVDRVIEVAQALGGDVETRYVSIAL
jgi:hypothetical protein